MQDFEKMTLFELREAILKEHTEHMRRMDRGKPIDFKEYKKKGRCFIAGNQQKAKRKE